MPDTSKKQVEHWIKQIEFQHEWIKNAYEEKRYTDVRKGFELMLSMLLNSAIPDAKKLEGEETAGE